MIPMAARMRRQRDGQSRQKPAAASITEPSMAM